MKISACYITKNEAENLARSIKSLQGQADEIIVADTGSTDDTVAVAKKLGARVYNYSWQDDFAAARNFAMSKVTGDWIILLDADEYFTEKTAGNLRKIIEGNPGINGLVVQIVNYDIDKKEVQDHFFQLRAVKRMPGLAYVGCIHEWLGLNGKLIPDMRRVAPKLLEIYHTGYRSTMSTKKAERNLRLLQNAVAQGESETELGRYFCEAYLALGNEEKMLEYGWNYIRQGRQNVSYAARCHRILLAHYAAKQDWESRCQRLKVAEIAVEQFPEMPDFQAEYSECLFQWKRYQEAAEASDRALAMLQDYQGVEPSMLIENGMEATLKKRNRLLRQQAEAAAKLKITACVIVKNEGKNIAQWLDNAAVFADEILAADTGSEDNTKEILTQRGIDYFTYQWQDDFAAAKNFLLEKAQGEWIVFTDADELFKYPESLRGCVLDFAKRAVSGNAAGRKAGKNISADRRGIAANEIEAISVPLYNIDTDNNNALMGTNTVVRIFRNQPKLRYQGSVHEQLTDMDCPGGTVTMAQGDELLAIEHTGYSAGVNRQKLERNLKMLEQEISLHGEADRHYKDIAVCYFGLGDYEQALNFALRASQSPWQPLGQQGDIYWLALEAMENLDYGLEDKKAVTEAALRIAGEIPDFWGYKGCYLLQEGNVSEAQRLLQKALSMAADMQKQKLMPLGSHISQLQERFRTALGDCRNQLGDSKGARQEYLQVLHGNKWYIEALTGYIDTFADLDNEELHNELRKLYGSNQQDWQQLAGQLKLQGYVPDGSSTEEFQQQYIQNIQYLVVGLLGKPLDLSSPVVRGQLGLLPESARYLVLAYHEQGGTDKQIAFLDYRELLQGVIQLGNQSMLERFVALGKDYTPEEFKQLGEMLLAREKWSCALAMFSGVPAEAPAADSQFWLDSGKAFYQLGEFAAAEECFQHVSSGAVNERELASYQAWTREALGK